MILKRFFYAAVLFLCLPGIASSQNKGDKKNGNPIFAGWYADPEGIIYGDTFWVYPTLSLLYGEDVEKYGQDLKRETDAIRSIIFRRILMLFLPRIWFIGLSIRRSCR